MADARNNGGADEGGVDSIADAAEHTPADDPRSSASSSTRDVKRFGKYQLLTELGRGGMATVYLAVGHAGIQDVRKLVVIKLLNESLRTDAGFVEMFAREARIAAELSHPNIVVTHTVGQEEGRYYIAMEYLEGVTLREIMRYSGEWPLQDRLPLFGAMCLALTGLGYVHDFHDHRGKYLGLVHRDIKPDNIFITTSGQVKLLDFGVAQTGVEPTGAGQPTRGTVQYLAPEATKADCDLDLRSDLFSAGVTLAELATGRRFWNGLPAAQILTRLAADELPTPTIENEDEVSPPLARLLERALHPDPIARFQTSLELRKAIQSFLTRQGYRVNTADLAKLVVHLFEPTRKQREEVIRLGLEAMDRSRPPSGIYLAAVDSSEHDVATPSGPVREDTALPVQSTDTASPPPRDRTKAWLAAAAVLLLIAIPSAWALLRDPKNDAPKGEPVAAAPADPAPAATRSEPPAPDPAPAPAVQPAPTVTPTITPTPPPSEELAPPTTSLPDEPAPGTATTPAPSSSKRSPTRSSRPKSKDRSSPPKTEEAGKDDTPPPAKPPGKKVELEPSPYTR